MMGASLIPTSEPPRSRPRRSSSSSNSSTKDNLNNAFYHILRPAFKLA